MVAVPRPRLVVTNGRTIAGSRKAARLACQPTKQAARLVRDIGLAYEESCHVIAEAQRLVAVLRAFAVATRAGDPITTGALVREADIQAGYVAARASNLASILERTAPGGVR